MSTYTFDTDTFRWSEAHIYGSSRIGVYNADKVLVVGTTTQNSHLQANEHENIRGKRHYELSNHLGNVLAVVSDRRTGICTGNGLVAYNAEVVSATDYYAFGSPMPGRQGIQQCSTVTNTVTVTNYAAQEDFSSSSVGGFVAGSGSRTVSNPTGDVLRIGSTWTTRPQASKSVTVLASTNYTLNFDLDSFSFMFGYSHTVRVTVILPGGGSFNTDYNNTGNKTINFTSTVAGNATIRFSSIINGSGVYSPNPFIDIDNFSVYNITTTTTTSTVCSVWDKGYRYGFNGKEKDNEINVNGGSYDFGARIYDSRLGRWLSLDPVRNTSWSSYASFKNSPIAIIDPNGETDFYNQSGDWIGTDGDEKTSGELKIITDRKVLKQIEKTSKKGESYINELPNGTYYKLPEKKVLDAIVAVFDASQNDVIGYNGKVIAKGGEHESGTTFDNDGNQTPIVNGPQMNKNTSAEVKLPEYGTISIHAHIMETAENRLHNYTNANKYGPSQKDISSFTNFTSNIIIQPNANLEFVIDPITKKEKEAQRKWVVSTYSAKVEKVNDESMAVATLVNETDYDSVNKIQSGNGKKDSKTYKTYEAKRKKD